MGQNRTNVFYGKNGFFGHCWPKIYRWAVRYFTRAWDPSKHPYGAGKTPNRPEIS